MQSSIDLSQAICRLFDEHLFIEIPDTETDLMESGIMDSLTLVGLLTQLEREFGLTVDMETLNIDDFRSVNRVAAYVARCQKGAHVDHV